MKTMTTLRSRMHLAALALAALCGALAQPLARADIFLCVDANGRRELTDRMRPGCKGLDVPGSIPAPGRRAGGVARTSVAVATPADFPRVDSAQQKARDSDRRDILNEELRDEERRLAEMRREFNGGEPERHPGERDHAKYRERVTHMQQGIARAEKNVAMLKREISNIK